MRDIQNQGAVPAHGLNLRKGQETPVRFVDLSGEVCPMTFVKLKLHLDRINPGELIEVMVNQGEHMKNIPRNIKDEGHKIEAVSPEGDKYHLLVRKRH